jgi:hypothetical protein
LPGGRRLYKPSKCGPMKDRTNKGIINETRALYDRLYSLAHRLAERDRQAARNRGPVAKALLAVCLLAGMLAAATLVYGFITFPDAPIREAGSSYVGKQGAPHTREDYEWFKLWEMLMVASFGLAFLTGFGAVVAEKLSRRSKVTKVTNDS